MDIKIVRDTITKTELDNMAKDNFGYLVKAVVDLGRGIMAIGGELHSDEEAILLEDGGKQEDLWGINLYPAKSENEWLEFDSMINLRPGQGNRSRGVDDPAIQEKIRALVKKVTQT